MIKPLPLAQQIYELMKDKGAFKLSELQEVIENKDPSTIVHEIIDLNVFFIIPSPINNKNNLPYFYTFDNAPAMRQS